MPTHITGSRSDVVRLDAARYTAAWGASIGVGAGLGLGAYKLTGSRLAGTTIGMVAAASGLAALAARTFEQQVPQDGGSRAGIAALQAGAVGALGGLGLLAAAERGMARSRGAGALLVLAAAVPALGAWHLAGALGSPVDY